MNRYTHTTRRIAGMDPEDYPPPEELYDLELTVLAPARQDCAERVRLEELERAAAMARGETRPVELEEA